MVALRLIAVFHIVSEDAVNVTDGRFPINIVAAKKIILIRFD